MALQHATAGLLVVAATFQVFDGAAMIGRGVLRGTGDVRFPAVVGIVCAWVMTPPAAYLLGLHFGGLAPARRRLHLALNRDAAAGREPFHRRLVVFQIGVTDDLDVRQAGTVI